LRWLWIFSACLAQTPQIIRAISFLIVCGTGHPFSARPITLSIAASCRSVWLLWDVMSADVLWFRVHIDPRYHAMLGLEWLGYVGTACGQILLIEDVESERRAIEPSQACPACLAALEREQ